MANKFLILISISLVTIAVISIFSYVDKITKDHLMDSNGIKSQKGGIGYKNDITYQIAFVSPTFTNAAYNDNFYDFYNKYGYIHNETKIYDYVYKLTAKLPYASHNDTLSMLSNSYLKLKEHTKELLPKYDIQVIYDEDLHDGKIFDSNGNNAYDVLIFGHEEYVTQQMYDNLKKFVSNGGIIMFMDGNIFYAEVTYDSKNKTITLLKGHNWEYNGVYAKRSISERWFDETSSWIGSNFYATYADKYDNGTYIYQYLNDPFNYGPVRKEDQYVTNPDIHVIFDYKLNHPIHSVVTYWKPFGNGKVIVLGIFSSRIMTNATFLKFYDTLMLEYALKK